MYVSLCLVSLGVIAILTSVSTGNSGKTWVVQTGNHWGATDPVSRHPWGTRAALKPVGSRRTLDALVTGIGSTGNAQWSCCRRDCSCRSPWPESALEHTSQGAEPFVTSNQLTSLAENSLTITAALWRDKSRVYWLPSSSWQTGHCSRISRMARVSSILSATSSFSKLMAPVMAFSCDFIRSMSKHESNRLYYQSECVTSKHISTSHTSRRYTVVYIIVCFERAATPSLCILSRYFCCSSRRGNQWRLLSECCTHFQVTQ